MGAMFMVRKTLLDFPHLSCHYPMKWPKICAENNAGSRSQSVPGVQWSVAIQEPLLSFRSVGVVHTSDSIITLRKLIPCATSSCISIDSGVQGIPVNYSNVIGSTAVF